MLKIAAIAALLLASLPSLADGVKVSLDGLNPELENNARVFLSIAALEGRTDLGEAAIRRLHRRAPEQIRKALQPYGYYEPEVVRRLVRQDDGTWLASYSVKPGMAVSIRQLTIAVTGPGQNDAVVSEVLAGNTLQAGAPLRHDLYQNLKNAIFRAAYDQGYLDATFTTHALRVDPAAGFADIELSLETGARFAFGQITIEQDALSDELVRRYVGLEEGQDFLQSRLLDAQYALTDSGYFAAVQVTAERERAENLRVPIRIQATKRKRQRFSAGIGYGVEIGPRISFGWENRLINKSGHRANIDLQLAQTRTAFSTRYSIPIGDPRSERFVWSFANRSEDLGDDTRSRRQEFGASLTRLRGEWQRNTYLQLTREITDIGQTSSTDVLLLPGITYSRTRSDAPVQPRSGSRMTADLRGSSKVLGSDTDFVRLKLETRLIRPAGRGRLLLRGDVGTTLVNQFSSLPASQRFFAGGDRSVRGFGLNELGPRNAEGLNIGGRHFVAGSAELEWPIAGRWSTALFVDAGNAFEQFGDELEFSVGLGGRVRTPVGIVRLDLAKPVTEGGRSIRLHLSLGPDL